MVAELLVTEDSWYRDTECLVDLLAG